MTDKWQEIINRIQQFQMEIKKSGSVAWFRGHCSSEWKLHSNLHRHVKSLLSAGGIDPSDNRAKWILLEEYKTLYRRFKSDAWPLLNAKERADWGIIFSMQHYGIPTRLLDWTE